jgi:hypothetical protein
MTEFSHLAHYYDQLGREYAVGLDTSIVTACQNPKIRTMIEPLHDEVVQALKIKNSIQRRKKIKLLFRQINDVVLANDAT